MCISILNANIKAKLYGVFDMGIDISKNSVITEIINNVNIEIIDSGDAVVDSSWDGKAVSGPFSRLYYVYDGEAIFSMDNGTETHLVPGYAYLIPSNATFRNRCIKTFSHLFFHINIINATGYDILKKYSHIHSIKITDSKVNKLSSYYRSNDILHALLLKEEIYKSVTSILTKMSNIDFQYTNYSINVERTIEYIKNNLSIQLNIPMLSKMLYISESTLTKQFKHEVGITISKYIDDLVFYKAQCMLVKTNKSINQISSELGFCDQFYFSRRFTMKFNENPQKYRIKRKT